MTTHDPDHGPCRPLRPLLDAAADGRTRGVGVWYARLHAVRCPGCGRYLGSLRGMLERLRRAHDESDDEAAIARLESRLS